MTKLRYPEHLETSMQECFDELKDDFEYETESEGTINEIEHASRDGFIPFTDGGLHLTIPVTLYDIYGRGKTFGNDKVAAQLDTDCQNSLQMALEAFCETNETELKKLFTTEQLAKPSYDDINYHDLYETGNSELAEILSETEQAYMTEGSTFWVDFRVQYYSADNYRNESGVDEICFLSGVNLDYDYGRDKGLETVYEATIPVKGLTVDIIKQHIKNMAKDI